MDKERPYWIEIDEGCRQAVAESGIVDYEWSAPFERDANMQSDCIAKAVENKVDVILISAIPGELVDSGLKKAVSAGVKVIYVDNSAEPEGIAELMTDNEEAGKTAGMTMLNALKNSGVQSGVIGVASNIPEMKNTSLRDKGFRSVFEGSAFEVAPTIYARGNPNLVVDSLKEHSDYVGFFGANQTLKI